MKLAGSFEAAVGVAEQNCREWIFTGDGDVVHAEELHEIAREYDAKTPLEEDELLAVTEDGSIGLVFPYLKEPQWYFVSPEFAVVNILKEDIHKYMIPLDDGTEVASGSSMTMEIAGGSAASYGTPGADAVFCKNCGARLDPDDLFCGNCGARNAPAFCRNCGAKLNPDDIFCANCGSKV